MTEPGVNTTIHSVFTNQLLAMCCVEADTAQGSWAGQSWNSRNFWREEFGKPTPALYSWGPFARLSTHRVSWFGAEEEVVCV
jgi:hypothetical protein